MTLKVAANSVACESVKTISGYNSNIIIHTSTALPFGTNISPLTFELSKEKNDRLHIKITDPNNKRWEVPTK